MNSKIMNPRLLFITSAILIAAVSRLFPHIPNFTPIAAMALFGGAYLSDKRLAIAIPLLALFISDLGLQLLFGKGLHATMTYVYVGFILTSIIGIMISNNITIKSIATGSIISSLLFFLITNFGVWAAYSPQTGLAGLEATYILGIPFFAPTLAGDLLFNSILFSAFYFAQTKYPVLIKYK